MVVKEIEWLPRNMRFEPQSHLAQLHCQGVHIDPINALANDVSQGRTIGRRRGLLFAGAHYSKLSRDPPCTGQQDVALNRMQCRRHGGRAVLDSAVFDFEALLQSDGQENV